MARFSANNTHHEPAGRAHRSLFSRLFRLLLPAAASSVALTAAAGVTIDFGDLSLEEDSFWNGSDGSGGFMSGDAFFNNRYDSEWNVWSGWAYSNVIDTETRGHENQYAAIPGAGLAGNGIYGVANVDHFTPVFPTIELPGDMYPASITIANTTYAYFSMLDGDDFAKEFRTEDGDWFRLDIRGLDGEGNETGILPFYLADYRFDDPEDAYIIDEWTEVDLSALGAATRSLQFNLTSSDTGDFGMNTPAYFALGEVTVVPEPATVALLAGAGILGSVLLIRRRRFFGRRDTFS